jgi:hypothetical protein
MAITKSSIKKSLSAHSPNAGLYTYDLMHLGQGDVADLERIEKIFTTLVTEGFIRREDRGSGKLPCYYRVATAADGAVQVSLLGFRKASPRSPTYTREDV